MFDRQREDEAGCRSQPVARYRRTPTLWLILSGETSHSVE